MKNTTCPECQVVLKPQAKSCRCGWIVCLSNTSDEQPYRCHYQFQGRRCPLVGTVSDGFKTHWYCSAHAQSRHNPRLAEAVLLDIEKNLAEWTKPRKDWREELCEHYLKKQPNHLAPKKKSLEEELQQLKRQILTN